MHDSFNVLQRIRFGKQTVVPGGPMIIEDYSERMKEVEGQESGDSSNISQLNPEELLDRTPCDLSKLATRRPFKSILVGAVPMKPKHSVAPSAIPNIES